MSQVKLGDKNIQFIYQGNELLYPNTIKDGLVLWYDFKGMKNNDVTKGVTKDLSGKGNDGVLRNFAYTSDSGYNNGLKFDGVDDTVNLINPLFNQGKESQNWTATITLKPINNNTSIEFILRGINLGIGIRYMDGKNKILNYINNSDKAFLYSKEGLPLKQFSEFTCSYDHISRTVSIYINGILDTQKVLEEGKEPSGMGYNMIIGTRRDDYIYSLKVYNRALTEEEIQQNYQLEKERWGL